MRYFSLRGLRWFEKVCDEEKDMEILEFKLNIFCEFRIINYFCEKKVIIKCI